MVEVVGVLAVDLSRWAVVFEPAFAHPESRIAFWDNDRGLVARMSLSEALPVLSRAGRAPAALPTFASVVGI